MIFGKRQQAQPGVFLASTGAAALSALGHPRADAVMEPAKRPAAGDSASQAWPDAAPAVSIRALILWMTVACAVLTALTSIPSRVAEPPTSPGGAAGIDAEEARQLMDAGAMMLDTRSARQFAQGRIRGALNTPYEGESGNELSFDHAKDSFDLTQLPADKTAPLVFYCAARACWTGYKASRTARAAGHGNATWLRGGFAEWLARGYPVATHDPRTEKPR